MHHWSQHQGLYKVLLKLHISVKIKTSKKWTFVSQDINDNAPIFDRANYDVPVAQVNYFARWHHLILHHNYQPPSILMAIDKVILPIWWEKESCKTWPICWLTVLRQCFVGESRLFKCCRKTNLLHRLALSISTFFLGIPFPNVSKDISFGERFWAFIPLHLNRWLFHTKD